MGGKPRPKSFTATGDMSIMVHVPGHEAVTVVSFGETDEEPNGGGCDSGDCGKCAWTREELSTLVYVETRAVDYQGIIGTRHLNKKEYKYLDALEDAGLVINKVTGHTRYYWLTDEGWRVAGLERRRQAEQHHKDPEGT